MGLLEKARDSRIHENDIWDDLFQKLQKLEAGVDFPVVLFQQIINFLSIQKAALFFRSENEDHFECMSSKGYDKTTTRRLRMDRNITESTEFQSMLSDKRSTLSQKASPYLKDYMSSREFGLIEEIHWLPFFYNDKIICIIMMSQWNSLVPENWQEVFDRISTLFSLNLYTSRKLLINQNENGARRPGREELLKRITALNTEDFFLIEIDLTDLLKMLMDLKDGLSFINLKKDIISVFRTMAGPEQELIDMENNKILLILDKKRVPDKNLFIHQLSASLPLLFQDLQTPPLLNTRDFEIPESEDEQEKMIRTMM